MRDSLRRLLVTLWTANPASLKKMALAGVAANGVIMATGAAVRLSSSGLGCPDWPRCSPADIIASHVAHQTLLNTWIEFGNRLLTFPLSVIAGLVFIMAWRAYWRGTVPRGLVWLALVQPLGVVAQAVIGGILVLAKLNPVLVSIHFLVSCGIVAASVALYVAIRNLGSEASQDTSVRRELVLISGLLALVTVGMLAAGTVVTGTGPLAGHADTPRYHLPLTGVTQLHADIGWLMGGLTLALATGLHFSGAPRQIRRAGWLLLGGLLAQGTMGYIQYFTHLPAGLVWVHVSSAVALWIAILWMFLTISNFRIPLSDHDPDLTPVPAAERTMAGR